MRAFARSLRVSSVAEPAFDAGGNGGRRGACHPPRPPTCSRTWRSSTCACPEAARVPPPWHPAPLAAHRGARVLRARRRAERSRRWALAGASGYLVKGSPVATIVAHDPPRCRRLAPPRAPPDLKPARPSAPARPPPRRQSARARRASARGRTGALPSGERSICSSAATTAIAPRFAALPFSAWTLNATASPSPAATALRSARRRSGVSRANDAWRRCRRSGLPAWTSARS